MATKRPRKTQKAPKEPPVTTVGVNINGAYINIENVEAKKAGPTLAAILDVIRHLQKTYPELRMVHPTMGGYSPLDVWDDWDQMSAGERRKIGFQ